MYNPVKQIHDATIAIPNILHEIYYHFRIDYQILTSHNTSDISLPNSNTALRIIQLTVIHSV